MDDGPDCDLNRWRKREGSNAEEGSSRSIHPASKQLRM